MLGHERIRRSVQLRSTYRGGKAKEVTLNLHLENEPSGCVIWMMFDKDTLELGHFLWLGGPPGEAMAELDGKVGRHTKGDRNGRAAEHARRFKELVSAACDDRGGRSSAVRGAWRCHLNSGPRSRSPFHSPAVPAGERQIIPAPRRWRSRMARAGAVQGILLHARGVRFRRSNFFAHLIDGYRLAHRRGSAICRTSTGRFWPRRSAPGLGVEPPWSFGWRCLPRTGLFANGGYEPGGEYRRQLDDLCATLRDSLTRHLPY